MRPTITLRRALADPNVLAHTLQGPSWSAWRTLLIAAMGEALDDEERGIFKRFTGREHEPMQRVEELVCVIGRRGGKSRATAALAAYIAALCDHTETLVPGERGVCLIIAPDQRQATVTLNYIGALFAEGPPLMKAMLRGRSGDTIELTNNVTIEVRAASYRRLRGPTYIAVIADECAFWLSDETSANPDTAILNAVRPGLSTTGGPLIMISSPYAKRGELFDAYRRYFGKDEDPLILVAQGASRDLNPSLRQSVVDRAMERDPSSARAEYLAEFRSDVGAFVSAEAVAACVSPGVRERVPDPKVAYHAFVDPSGGSNDSFSLAIAHNDIPRQTVIIDCVRELRPPFSPEQATDELCKVIKSYGLFHVVGDRYGGLWPVEQFSKFGISYEQSARPKSELYVDVLPMINSGRVELLDDPRLISQLCNLERKTARGGRDSIDHPPGGHDDICNAVAGVAAECSQLGGYNALYGLDNTDEADAAREAARAERQAKNPHGLTLEHYRAITSPVCMLAREYVDAEREKELRQQALEEIEKVRERERAEAGG